MVCCCFVLFGGSGRVVRATRHTKQHNQQHTTYIMYMWCVVVCLFGGSGRARDDDDDDDDDADTADDDDDDNQKAKRDRSQRIRAKEVGRVRDRGKRPPEHTGKSNLPPEAFVF